MNMIIKYSIFYIAFFTMSGCFYRSNPFENDGYVQLSIPNAAIQIGSIVADLDGYQPVCLPPKMKMEAEEPQPAANVDWERTNKFSLSAEASLNKYISGELKIEFGNYIKINASNVYSIILQTSKAVGVLHDYLRLNGPEDGAHALKILNRYSQKGIKFYLVNAIYVADFTYAINSEAAAKAGVDISKLKDVIAGKLNIGIDSKDGIVMKGSRMAISIHKDYDTPQAVIHNEEFRSNSV